MVSVIVFVIAVIVGFIGSRLSRRSPDTAITPPAPPRTARSGRERARPDQAVRSDRSRRAPPRRSHRGLTAPELERAALVEALGTIRVGGDGRVMVPERITLRLHPDDVRLLDGRSVRFEQRLAAAIESIAVQRGWQFTGSLTIDRRADPSRRPGFPGVDEPVTPHLEPEGTTVVLRRSDDDRVHRLVNGPVTIGRGEDRDIIVDDHRVSRNHARIERRGARWLLTDSGSANGTFVDGHRLPAGRSFVLVVGATIGIGPVEFRVAPAERSHRAADHSPALSETERIDLARTHLRDGGRSRR